MTKPQWSIRMKIERRKFVTSMGWVLGAMGTGSVTSILGGCMPKTMEPTTTRPLGIQLYTVKEAATADFVGTLKALADIGYTEVELPNLFGKTPESIRADLDAAGLTCPSVHVFLKPFYPGMPSLEDFEYHVSMMKTLGAKNVVVALFPIPERYLKDLFSAVTDLEKLEQLDRITRGMTIDEWRRFARQLNEKGAALQKENLRISYHNHSFEFAPLEGTSGSVMDFLIAETDPDLVDFELDAGWALYANVDPAAFLDRYSDRITQIHLKDVSVPMKGVSHGVISTNVGQGDMDWRKLIAAISRSNIEHFYVEQEAPFTVPPIEATQIAFDFLSPRFK